jgi:amidohydrolase
VEVTPGEVHRLASELYPKVREVREHLHRYPELSFREFKTSDYIQDILKSAGIEFTAGHVKTGIIAIIRGKDAGKRTLLLRADMDALPIEEENDVPFRSQNKGVMHACGHDVHTACVLGATLILNRMKDKFSGTVKVMFQPGEEVLPGGASLMIKEGVLENPKVDKALAMHVFPGMEAGRAGFRGGVYMASTDELYLTVTGKGGHAAMPADYINPLVIASEIILKVNEAFMKAGALKGTHGENVPTVVAFGRIEGNGVCNVIPGEVKVDGTFRTMDERWRSQAHGMLREIATSAAAKYGGRADLRIEKGYPVLVNDAEFTASCFSSAKAYLGYEQVDELPLRMTGEDFAYITHEVPSCFFRLGVSNKSKGITSGVHTSTFNIDDKALETGTGLMAWLAIEALS